MPHELQQDECDLAQYPKIVSTVIRETQKEIHDKHDNDEVTAGDLHGNALYLLHFLIKYSVIELDKASYQEFVKIYQKPAAQITKADFQVFDSLLKNAKVNNNKKVRLLGDILADRGKNDYFTLKVIELLDKAGADLTILLSNHDAEFMLNVELNAGLRPPFQEKMMAREFCRSIEGLVNSIGKGDLDQANCENLYRNHFLPHVKAIDYCFESTGEDDKPQLFTHAPVDLNLMVKVAEELGLSFDKETDESLKQSIDAVNKKIQEILLSGQFHQICEEMISVDSETYQQVKGFWDWSKFEGEVTTEVINEQISLLTGENKNRFANRFPSIARRQHVGINLATKQARALTRLLWNRDFSDLAFDSSQPYRFVHGHDSQVIQGNIHTLDGLLGKGDDHMKGRMPALATKYDLGKYYQFVQYEIKEKAGQRVLTLDLVDKRGRFYCSNMSYKVCVGLDKGLSNKDVISRLRAMFAYKGSERRLVSDKKAIRKEFEWVMSWPRPEGVSCEEIYERLKNVYEVNKEPCSHEIARVFNFNNIDEVKCKLEKSEGKRILHVEEYEKHHALGKRKIAEFDIQLDVEIEQDEAANKLKPLYSGQRLKPTTSSMVAQFSSVFSEPKRPGTGIQGKVEIRTDAYVKEELEVPLPNLKVKRINR